MTRGGEWPGLFPQVCVGGEERQVSSDVPHATLGDFVGMKRVPVQRTQ